MSSVSIDQLQLRALEQRRRLHKTASDLRDKVQQTREKLSPARQAHDHLLPISIVAGVIALGAGYGIAGLFTGR